MQIGNFDAGPPLIVASTVIDEGTATKKEKKVRGYLARIELTQANLEGYTESIENVFAALPWE